MKLTARQNEILQILKEKDRVCVNELKEKLFVSDMTVRRDLKVLQEERLIKRYHGGAIAVKNPHLMPMTLRRYWHENEKRQLGKMAEKYLSDDQMVFLDSSSTCLYVIPFLRQRKNISVVTNSVTVALTASENGIPCTLTGGTFYEPDMCLIGEETVAYLSTVRPDLAFFSARGYDEEHKICYDDDLHQVAVRRAVIKNAVINIFMFDHSKKGITGPYIVCEPERITELIVV